MNILVLNGSPCCFSSEKELRWQGHGQFDFPQKKEGTIIGMYLVRAMLSSKKHPGALLSGKTIIAPGYFF